MNRKHVPAVIGLLVLLVPACLCLPSGTQPEDLIATASVMAPTLVAALKTADAEQTLAAAETAAAPTEETFIAATPTSEATATTSATPATTPLPPTATPSSTDTLTPAPTVTPTEAPPLAAISDVCKLLDLNLAANLLGEKMVNTQKLSQKGQPDRCYAGNANFSTGATLGVAQDDAAVNFQLMAYAELDAAKGCAKPAPVGPDQVKAAQTELQKMGLTGNALIRESLTWEGMLIREKGCADQYGFQEITGLGDYAFTDHIYGYQETVVVTRNTIVYMGVYKKDLAAPDAVADEKQLCQAALNFLGIP